MIIVNTGNGKGKTTAALGAAMRAVGEGKRVLMIQFIKGPWKSGEDLFISKIKNQKAKIDENGEYERFSLPDFEIIKTGKGFVGILGDSLPRGEHQKAASEGFLLAKTEGRSGSWDVLILDEVHNAVALGLIPKEDLVDFMEAFPKERHLVLTGRDAADEVIARADIVTEMREIKHVFNEGAKAKRGQCRRQHKSCPNRHKRNSRK